MSRSIIPHLAVRQNPVTLRSKSVSMSGASPRPQKRTAQTCVTCRARKVRCDGRKGICTNCDRLGLPCSWDDTFAVEGILVPSSAILTAPNQQQQQQQHQLPLSDPRINVNNNNNPPTSTPPLLIPRRRARQACQNCHAKKARCSGSMPKCDRCRVQGLECIYRPGKRALVLPSSTSLAGGQQQQQSSGEPQDVTMQDDGTASLTHSNTASPNQTPSLATPPPLNLPLAVPSASPSFSDPPESLIFRTFENYFQHVHHIPVFSFLHRASLMERYNAGSLDRSLLLALVGITSMLTDLGGPDMVEYGQKCIDEAAALCLAHAEQPSILRLQALVIVVKHRILSKRFQGAFLLFSLASRMAMALRLNTENPSLCFLAQESRRRLMWSIYLIDSTMSGGQVEVALWPNPERQIRINLPCNERRFELDLPEVTEPLIPPPPPFPSSLPDPEAGGSGEPHRDAIGLLALHIRMYHMRARILQRTMRVVASGPSQIELDKLPSVVASTVAELEAFESRLLPSFRFSESSLKLRSYSSRLGIFFMTHIWWRQCHLDLYRLFLPGLKEALPLGILKSRLDAEFVVNSRRRCYDHARSMADMFAHLLAPGMGVPVTDIDIAGCASQCVRVLYHGLQTWGAEIGFTREVVEQLAEGCLRAARGPTMGSEAGKAILADIERVMKEGVKLVMGPVGVPPATSAMVFPNMGSSGDSSSTSQPPSSSPATVTQAAPQIHVSAAVTPTISSMPPGFSPITASQGLPLHQQTRGAGQVEPAAASVAPSQSSAITSGSNAFEESLDDLASFGPDFFADDLWASTLAPGGNMMSSNDWLNSMSTMQLPPPPPPPPEPS